MENHTASSSCRSHDFTGPARRLGRCEVAACLDWGFKQQLFRDLNWGFARDTTGFSEQTNNDLAMIWVCL